MSILFRYLAILRILLISLSYYSSVTDSESNKKKSTNATETLHSMLIKYCLTFM